MINNYFKTLLTIPIQFPISYGVFFFFPFIPFSILNNKVYICLCYLYPFVFITSLIGLFFSLYFLIFIQDYIHFQSLYYDPILYLYPCIHKNFYYRIHLLLIILLKINLIRFWPFLINSVSFLYSFIFFIFMYVLNVFLYYIL